MLEVAMSRFEQLDKDPTVSWLRLPVWVRGYGDELLRHADTDGSVCATDSPADVAIVLRAHPDEIDRLAEAMAQLAAQGFLLVSADGVFITNYRSLRERKLARLRQQKRRDRDATEPSPPVTPRHAPSRSVTLGHERHKCHVEERRVEKSREEEIRDLSGEVDPKDLTGRRARNRPVSPPHAADEPLQDRARALRDNPAMGIGLGDGAAAWPEVVAVVEAYRRESGLANLKLGSYHSDSGLRAIVELFAMGHSVAEVCVALRATAQDAWWQQGRRSLGALTPEVFRRLSARAGPAPTGDEQIDRIRAKAAELVASRAPEGRRR